MSKNLSKADLKNPDLVTAELQKGFGWSVRHSKLVIFIVVALVLVGALAAIWQSVGDRRELKAQTQFYSVEKSYNDKKEKFEAAQSKVTNPVAEEKTLPKNKKGEVKADKAVEKATVAPVEGLASGDMEKDYGTELKGFQNVMSEYRGSKAAKMSALALSEIYGHYGKNDQALEVLKSSSLGNDLLSSLLKDRQASLLADAGQCDEAATLWNAVKGEPAAKFLKDDIQLREGVCFMGVKKYAQAQAAFKNLDPKSSDFGKAEKWLRLIPQDKVSETTTK